ncbi:MAG: hypothetical protein OHK0050_41060 [Roseiflexaceae bacterium]
MRRVFALWRMYAALDFAFVAADLRMVLIFLFSDAITNVALVSGMLLLAERFDGIGPWQQDEIIFLLGYATSVNGLIGILFGYNVFMISRRIGRGQFDHTLVQPQPIWMALLTEGFMPFSGAAILLPGLVLLGWSFATLNLAISAGWIALFLLNLLASITCVMSFTFIWGSLAFWAPRSAEEISSSAGSLLEQLKPFPLDGLAPLMIGGLLSFAPVGFVAWYPCRALLDLDPVWYADWITPLAAIVFATLATLIFQKGLHVYGRTGSQRYSSFGHRS